MTQSEAPKTGGFSRGLGRFFRDLVIIVVVAFAISFVLKTFLLRSFYIPSGSMEHTLEINDRILVNQLVPRVVGVQRGDVVVFQDPGGWLNLPAEAKNPTPTAFESLLQTVGLAADTSTDFVVKRVIGIGGDHVVCCDANGRVTVNGVPLDEPYITVPEGSPASGVDFDVVVPEGSLWVMGDNRYSSLDSRYHQEQPGKGFVPEAELVGRAFVLNWPLSRFTWLDNYPDTFTGVAEAQTAPHSANPGSNGE